MGATRLRGQEVEVQLIENGKLVDTMTAVRSFDMTIAMKVLSESYLGETTTRKDDIYEGVSGKMEFHLENKDWGRVVRAIINRARRRQTNEQINITGKVVYPNGDIQKFTVSNVFFSNIPVGFPKRDEYVTFALNFEAEDIRFIN